MVLNITYARSEMEHMVQQWGFHQFIVVTLDLLCVSFINNTLQNSAIKLLTYLSFARYLFGGFWFLIASGYTQDYSDELVKTIWMCLEVGWYHCITRFIADHTSSASTIQKAFPLVNGKREKWFHVGVFIVCVIIGLVLRVYRNLCRFQYCLLKSTDSFISINVILMEAYLLSVISLKIYLSYRKTPMMTQVMYEGLMRVKILLPLGILESTCYYLQYLASKDVPVPLWMIWLTSLGIYARMMYPTILAISVIKTRLVLLQLSVDQLTTKRACTPNSG